MPTSDERPFIPRRDGIHLFISGRSTYSHYCVSPAFRGNHLGSPAHVSEAVFGFVSAGEGTQLIDAHQSRRGS